MPACGEVVQQRAPHLAHPAHEAQGGRLLLDANHVAVIAGDANSRDAVGHQFTDQRRGDDAAKDDYGGVTGGRRRYP